VSNAVTAATGDHPKATVNKIAVAVATAAAVATATKLPHYNCHTTATLQQPHYNCHTTLNLTLKPNPNAQP